jgi:hypothetical protein
MHSSELLCSGAVVISYRRFGTPYQSHLQSSRIQKKVCSPNKEFIKGRVRPDMAKFKGLYHTPLPAPHTQTPTADKFLDRPISRCRRTELIRSLERGACSCAELQFLLLQRLRGSMPRDARDFNIETQAVIKIFSRKTRLRRKFAPF